MTEFVRAESEAQLESARELFIEYQEELGIDLCFQNFQAELERLPGKYSTPQGCLLLVYHDEKLAGCMALKRISDITCEMKRMFLRSEFRGNGIGRVMTLEIINRAREIGYSKMRLDTVPQLKAAIALYRSLGFVEIEPYRDNPIPGSLYMELTL